MSAERNSWIGRGGPRADGPRGSRWGGFNADQQMSFFQLIPDNIKWLAYALEGILPAIRAIADGAEPRLEDFPSSYDDPTPPWLEEDESLVCLVVTAKDLAIGGSILSFDEMKTAADGLLALREYWIMRTGGHGICQ